jgi:hypothetical protein
MLKSKAIDIIKTFSAEELKRFLSFVNSPFFNTDKSIIRISEALRKYYPEFKSDNLTDKNIYEEVYGKGKFSNSSLKNLMSELLTVCEKYLFHERMSRDYLKNDNNSIELLIEYRERNLEKLFDSRSKKLGDMLKKRKIENHEYFILSNKLEILNYQFHLSKHKYNSQIWQGFLNRASFDLCGIFHTLYVDSAMLMHSAEILNGKQEDSLMVNIVKDLDLEQLLKKIKHGKSEEYFFVSLYSNLILLSIYDQEDKSEKYYYEIKSSFLKNINYFSDVDIYDILKSLRSYCIERMRKHKSAFIDELFEIDKLLIKKVNYSSNLIKWYIGELFTELVHLAIYKKEYEFAENFIEEFKIYLNKDVIKFETGYTKAYLNLEYGNTEKALELLSSIKPINSTMKILIKNLYLRAYYEMEYFEEAISMLDTHIHFVKKGSGFSDKRKELFKMHHNVFLNLYRMKMNPGKYSEYDVLKVRDELDKFYFLADKDWYIQKLDELNAGFMNANSKTN